MLNLDWQIIYSSTAGVQGRALEFLYGELGNYVLRDYEKYQLHTMACYPAAESLPPANAVIIGRRAENPLLQRFIAEDEVPPYGYSIRIIANPAAPDKQLVLLAGSDDASVLYSVVEFVDDILPYSTQPENNGIICGADVLQSPLPEISIARKPASRVRSVFTWAHPVGDIYSYFKNMARLRINRVYMWNEYPPLNAAEVVQYANSWGIEIFWGFSWGWEPDCQFVDISDLAPMRKEIMRAWRDIWSKLPGDGIYFQSFTETRQTSLSGRSIAGSVTELINSIAAEILSERPALQIVYGLHASSVRDKLAVIDQTDPRLSILWEDCGNFPFTHINSPETPAEDQKFLSDILAQQRAKGVLIKCQLLQRWGCFAHPAGPYILGHNGEKMQQHDTTVARISWKNYSDIWCRKGILAYNVIKQVQQSGFEVEVSTSAQLNGPVHWVTALIAELFWDCSCTYEEIFSKVQRKVWVI